MQQAWPVIVLAVLLVPATMGQVPIDFEVNVDQAVAMHGELTATIYAAAAIERPNGQAASLELTGTGSLVVHRHYVTRGEWGVNNDTVRLFYPSLFSEELLQRGVNGPLLLEAQQGAALELVSTTGTLIFEMDGSLNDEWLFNHHPVSAYQPRPPGSQLGQVIQHQDVATTFGSAQLKSKPTTLRLIATDSDIILGDGSRIVLERQAVVQQPPVNNDPGRLEYYDVATLTGTWSVSNDGASLAFIPVSLTGFMDGRLAFHGVDGPATIDGSEHEADHGIVEINGRFSINGSFAKDSSTWRVTGTAYNVNLDGEILPLRDVAPLVAAAAGLGMLAVAWLLLKGVAIWLASTRDVLSHDGRANIARIVLHEPGLTIMEISRRLGLGRSTVRHHLRVLREAGVVSKHRAGKIPVFTLNSGTPMFPPGNVEARHVFGAMTHPIRKLLLAAGQRGTITRHGFEAFLRERGDEVTHESTFRYHCRALKEVGILEQVSADSTGHWVLRIDLDAMQAHYRRAFLIRKNWQTVYDAAQTAGPDAEAVLRRIRHDNRHLSLTDVTSVLSGLENLGLVPAGTP